jgi:mannose-binding lectin 2
MAMWLTRQRGQGGQVFGHTDRFEGLGIFVDTYKNNRPDTTFPYVMAMVGDGHSTYDKDNDGKANEFAGCAAGGLRNAAFPTRMRLQYLQDKSMKLDLQYKGEAEGWTTCFETQSPPPLPSVSYLGFSAETGELSDNFDIISVVTRNLYNAGAGDDRGEELGGGGHKAQRQSGWLWFLFKCLLFLALCAGGYIGYAAYRTSRRSSF